MERTYKRDVEIWFELENKCNLSCKFCYNYWKDGSALAPRQLSAKDLIICFEKLRAVSNISKITLSGGEPLLRTDFFELVDYFHTLEIPLVLTTNGLLLNEAKIEILRNAGVRTFEVPLHSMDPDVHDFLSGAKCFDESLNTIITLKKSDVDIAIVFVATEQNLTHLKSVLEICNHLAISDLIFNRVIPSSLAKVNADMIGIPKDNAVCDVLFDAHEFAKKNKIKIHLGVPVTLDSRFVHLADTIISASCPVHLAQKRWTVDSGGNIRRCNHSSLSIGNLLKGGELDLARELSNISHVCGQQSHHACQFIHHDQDFDVRVV